MLLGYARQSTGEARDTRALIQEAREKGNRECREVTESFVALVQTMTTWVAQVADVPGTGRAFLHPWEEGRSSVGGAHLQNC